MCFLCDGGSIDDWRERVEGLIEIGWAITHVEAECPWSYTIGLSENFDHPELVVVGPPADQSATILDFLSERIEEGVRFADGDSETITGSLECRFAAVHAAQYDHGVFGSWAAYYDEAIEAPAFQALQVCLPRTMFCACHGHLQDRALARADDVLHRRPNRAERRARDRRRRRNHR